jgi:hypothetical protein
MAKRVVPATTSTNSSKWKSFDWHCTGRRRLQDRRGLNHEQLQPGYGDRYPENPIQRPDAATVNQSTTDTSATAMRVVPLSSREKAKRRRMVYV